MQPKNEFSDLEKALMDSKPATKSPSLNFEVRLREQLHAQASRQKRPFSLSSLLASAAGLGVITAVVFLFWVAQRQINQPQPLSSAMPASTSEARASALTTALERLQIEDFKPIGGQLLIPLHVQIEPISIENGVDLFGTYAIAEHEGSNIILGDLPFEEQEQAWLVQAWGVWQAFESEEQLYRFGAVLVGQKSGQIIIAGASAHHFLETQPRLTVSLADYPIQDEPYLLINEDGARFWLVHTEADLQLFDARAPYFDETRERCVVSWEWVNGRFLDPCSGDEWELDGTMNIPASTEMWSRNRLDSYYVTQEEDQLTIWLSLVEQAIQ